jgi:plastocyanin
VNFTNNGALEYAFIILKQGNHVTPPYQTIDNDKVMWYLVAPPGETKSRTFKAPAEPGKYDVFCPELGMKATLVVKEK